MIDVSQPHRSSGKTGSASRSKGARSEDSSVEQAERLVGTPDERLKKAEHRGKESSAAAAAASAKSLAAAKAGMGKGIGSEGGGGGSFSTSRRQKMASQDPHRDTLRFAFCC